LRSTDLNSGWTNLAIVNVLTNYVDFTDTSAPQPPHALYKALGIP